MSDQDRPLFSGMDEAEASLDQAGREGEDAEGDRVDVGFPPASTVLGGTPLGGAGPAAAAAGADALLGGDAQRDTAGAGLARPRQAPLDDFGSEGEDRQLDKPVGLGEDSQGMERDRDSTDPRGL